MKLCIAILGLLVTLFAGASDGSAATHVVTVQNFGFVPNVLTIPVGDTVRWEWASGTHTTTSGANPSDPDSGALWDQVIDSVNTEFEFTFTDPGSQQYYCRPHWFVGMTGVIHVEEGVPVDGATWGAIKRLFEDTRIQDDPSGD